MSPRDRMLMGVVLTVVILVGGGLLFKFVFWDALTALKDQVAQADQDLDKKRTELAQEVENRKRLFQRDPRLKEWKQLSLPEDKNQAAELKAGKPLEEVKKRHLDEMQVKYSSYLTDLMIRSGFVPASVRVSGQVDLKSAPILTAKVPAYTRLTFTVQGQSSYEGVVRMLEEFHRTPLLHEIHNITLTNRQQPVQPNRPGFGGPNRGQPQPGRGDLDVTMTIDALMVNGAEKREALTPDSTDVPPLVLADPTRKYTDMLGKNIFTGIPTSAAMLTEDKAQVLGAVKLTTLSNSGRRWDAYFYDQGKGPPEKHLTARTLNDFVISDKYGNTLLDAKVLSIDESCVIFRADGKAYRWRCGDMLSTVLDSPIKEDELKSLGLTAMAETEK